MNENLFEIFRRGFPAEPGGSSWAGRRRVLSYADLRSSRAGSPTSFGISASQPGDRVAAQVEKRPRRCCSISAPCGPVPSSCRSTPPTPPAEVRYFLGDAEPTVFVCRPERDGAIAALAASSACRTC